jgi:HEAT repeat protein
MRIVPRRAAIACLAGSILFSAAVARAEKDGRIRRDSVRAWLAALREPVQEPRQEEPAGWATAYTCLRKIGPDERAILSELIFALDDPNPRIRAIAAEVIGNIGPEAKDAVPRMRELLPK